MISSLLINVEHGERIIDNTCENFTTNVYATMGESLSFVGVKR